MSEEGQPLYKSSSVYNELRLEGKFCDAIIKVEDVEFPVHKIILWLFSPAGATQVFNTPGLSSEMMALIIDFAYTGSVSITEEIAVELLMAADRLNVMGIVKVCCDFLGEQLCPQNYFGIWQFTNVCLLPKLHAKAYHYIISNFDEVVLEEEFLQLTVEELADILDRDDLSVQLENTVFEALIKWISHVPEERERHLTALLSKIYICGGFNGNEHLQTAECYNPETNQWTMINPMNRRRSGIGVIAYADHVFAVGGFDGANSLHTAEAYNPHSNTWNLVSSMLTARSNVGIEVINDLLFAVKGFDVFTNTSNVECYDALTNAWFEVHNMDIFHSALSRCVVSGLPNLTEYTIPRDILPLSNVPEEAAESM